MVEKFFRIIFPKKEGPKSDAFPLFKIEGKQTPASGVSALYQTKGGNSCNPLSYFRDAPVEKPYCSKAEERWDIIMGDPNLRVKCQIHHGIEVRVINTETAAKTQYLVAESATVALKLDIPISQNEKTGLVRIGDQLYITSRIFCDQDGKQFVLIARHAIFNHKLRKQIFDFLES